MSPREYPDRPLVGVGVVVLRGSAVLLIQRGRPPAQGEWSLPGGAQRLGETIEAAARRELAEETGLRAGTLRLATVADAIHRDEAGRVRFHYSIIDLATDDAEGDPRQGGDATAIAWLPLAGLHRRPLAGDTFRAIAAACGGQGGSGAAPRHGTPPGL